MSGLRQIQYFPVGIRYQQSNMVAVMGRSGDVLQSEVLA